MANEITAAGLQTDTLQELKTKYEEGMKAIYGADINLDQDSPDGQQMMLIIQMSIDSLDLLREVYNSFDPDNAIGVTLDRRIAFNGIQRKGGSYSIILIKISTSRNVGLSGINDVGIDSAYTIEDDEGNKWVLMETVVVYPESIVLFQALEIGEVNATIGTITNPVTIVLGVESVTNEAIPVTLGTDEESDYELKIRRQRSVSRSSSGYLSALYAELEAVEGVTSTKIYENKTSVVDADGIPGHAIWVIVAGTALNTDVANAIYRKRNGGLNMKGAESEVIIQIDGQPFLIQWDKVSYEDVYIKFNVQSLDGENAPLIDEIKAELPNVLETGIGEKLNINELVQAVNSIDSNSLVTGEGFSLDNITFTSTIEATTKDKQLIITTAKIDITLVT